MEENLLNRFEEQLEALLKNYKSVKQNNAILENQFSKISTERDAWKKKHDTVVESLERVIKRLQEFVDENNIVTA
jgi:hypothetical protein